MSKTSEETLQLQNKIKKLEQQLEQKNTLEFLLQESIPQEQTDRKKYVSDIAFFYATIFKKKLQHFTGMQLEELSRIGRTEVADDIIRSNINCFRLIDEWMNIMSIEHFGDLEEIRESYEDDQVFIKDIKDKTK